MNQIDFVPIQYDSGKCYIKNWQLIWFSLPFFAWNRLDSRFNRSIHASYTVIRIALWFIFWLFSRWGNRNDWILQIQIIGQKPLQLDLSTLLRRYRTLSFRLKRHFILWNFQWWLKIGGKSMLCGESIIQ